MKNLLLEMSNFYVGLVDILKEKIKTNKNGNYYLALNRKNDWKHWWWVPENYIKEVIA